MRFLLAAIVAASFAANAVAENIPAGGSITGTLYEVSVSDATDVGDGLVSVILSVTNVSGNSDFDVNSITGVAFGESQPLHHDQFFGGAVQTPTAASFAGFGAAPSTNDSHFLPDVVLALDTPAEANAGLSPSGAASQLAPAQLGTTGFGALTGAIGFAPGTTIDIAQLVFPADGEGLDYRISFADADAGSAGESFSGLITLIPEPTSALLAGLASVGFLARRK